MSNRIDRAVAIPEEVITRNDGSRELLMRVSATSQEAADGLKRCMQASGINVQEVSPRSVSTHSLSEKAKANYGQIFGHDNFRSN